MTCFKQDGQLAAHTQPFLAALHASDDNDKIGEIDDYELLTCRRAAGSEGHSNSNLELQLIAIPIPI